MQRGRPRAVINEGGGGQGSALFQTLILQYMNKTHIAKKKTIKDGSFYSTFYRTMH